MSFKKFNEFIAEGMQTSMGDNPAGEEFNMSPSTNYVSQETDLKQVNPDYVDDDDEDKWNPSIINKDAVKSGDVTFVGKKKSKSRGLDTFGNRKNQYLTNFATNESTELEVGIEVEMEHTDDRKEAEKIAKDHLSEDPKYYSKLYKAGLIDEPKAEKLAKELDEGGFGDNQVAGQRVYTQHTDKSKQGYQDSMYYGDEEVDDHGPECDCTDCIEKYNAN